MFPLGSIANLASGSLLPAGASAFSPLGGGVDDISPSTPTITMTSDARSAAKADTRIQFSTGNMTGGSGLFNPINLGIIGIAALLGVVLLKVL